MRTSSDTAQGWTAKQDLERQIDALAAAGIPAERIYLDKKSGATTARPGLRTVLEHARTGDVIVVHTLDRLGRTVRDTLNLIHDLAGRGVGVLKLADPIKVDSANPDDPMAQLAVVMLALFAQMERTYMLGEGRQTHLARAARDAVTYLVWLMAKHHATLAITGGRSVSMVMKPVSLICVSGG